MKELTEEVLKDIENNQISWDIISFDYMLNEDFIRKYKDQVNWYYIYIQQKLSEDFIIEFEDRTSWQWICKWQDLSEDFIRKHKDKISWSSIPYSNLSEEFIIEFQDYLNFHFLILDAEKFSKPIQLLILKKLFYDIKHKTVRKKFLTYYMRKQYDKLILFS